MKRLTRRVLIGAIAVAVIILIPLVLIASIPKDRVRQIVVNRLEAAMQRPVRIRSADYRFFPDFRLRLEGVEVGGPAEPGKPRLGAASLQLGLQLLPLIHRHVVITGIEIDRPVVETVLASTPPASSAAPPSPTPSAQPLDLRLQSLRVEDGRVTLRLPDGSPLLEMGGLAENLSASLSSAGVAELSGVTAVDTLRLHMVSGVFGEGLRLRLQKKLRYEMQSGDLAIEEASLDLSGVPLSVQGKVSGVTSAEPRLDLSVKGGPGNLHDLVGLVPAQLFPQAKGLQSSGTLSVAGTITGPARNADFHLALTLENGRMQTPALPQPIEGILLRLRADPDSIVVEEFAARSAGSSLRAHATLTGYRQVPRFLVAAEADVDLGAISGLYAVKGSPQVTGRASASVIAEGRSDQPAATRIEGTARLAGVGLSGGSLPLPVRDLGADLLFQNQKVTLRSSSLRVGGSDFSASGSVENLTALTARAPAAGRARADVQLRSRQILLDELLPPPSKGKIALPPLPPLDGSFAFHADRVVSRGIELAPADGRISLDQGIVRLEGLNLGVFGGQVDLSGTMDLRQPAAPAYDLTAGVRGIAVRDLFAQARSLDRYSHLSGSLAGRLSTDLSMKGLLTDSLTLDPRSLTSRGNLEIAQAQLSGYPVQKAVAEYLSAPQLQTLAISQWKQGFHIDQGKVNVDGLSIKAGPVEVVANGWQSIDGEIAMSLDCLVPPSLIAGLRGKLPSAAAALVFAGGDQTFVPLQLSGSSSAPTVSVDTGRLTAAARQAAEAKLKEQRALLQQAATQQAGKLLRNVAAGKDSTGAGAIKKQVEDEVKNRLGRLFGK